MSNSRLPSTDDPRSARRVRAAALIERDCIIEARAIVEIWPLLSFAQRRRLIEDREEKSDRFSFRELLQIAANPVSLRAWDEARPGDLPIPAWPPRGGGSGL